MLAGGVVLFEIFGSLSSACSTGTGNAGGKEAAERSTLGIVFFGFLQSR